jgi:hypothetical protein
MGMRIFHGRIFEVNLFKCREVEFLKNAQNKKIENVAGKV